jgi:hypothetical protein
MTNTETIKTALIKQIIDSGSTLPLSVLVGNIDLLINTAKAEQCIAISENVIGSHITEPELKVEDLKAVEWYVITFKSIDNFDNHKIFLLKFRDIVSNDLFGFKAANFTSGVVYDYSSPLCPIQNVVSIRHATREEIIKYFPHEFEIDTHGANDIPQLTDPQL